jgi:molybdopterin-guanine dinucleotide biosynthesis protein A
MQLVDPAERRHPVGAILAGGEGTRIAGSKALVQLAGRPLISYPLGAVIAAGLEPLVVAKLATELPDLDVRVVRERARDAHPLHGVIAALEAAGGRPVVVVACDMPFVSRELLAWLGRATGTVLPRVRGVAQPLLARYEAAASAPLAAAVREGRSARAAAASLRPRLLDETDLAAFGDPLRLFFNVNDACDLKRAAALLGPIP